MRIVFFLQLCQNLVSEISDLNIFLISWVKTFCTPLDYSWFWTSYAYWTCELSNHSYILIQHILAVHNDGFYFQMCRWYVLITLMLHYSPLSPHHSWYFPLPTQSFLPLCLSSNPSVSLGLLIEAWWGNLQERGQLTSGYAVEENVFPVSISLLDPHSRVGFTCLCCSKWKLMG